MSTSATLACGSASNNDMVLMSDGRIGQVRSFYGTDDDAVVMVCLEAHNPIDGQLNLFEVGYEVAFVDAQVIVEILFWYPKSDSIFAVVPRFA